MALRELRVPPPAGNIDLILGSPNHGRQRSARPFGALSVLDQLPEIAMNIDRIVMAFAGTFILATVLLAVYHNINWLWLTGFVGVNLLQSSLTGFCPLASILKKMGTQQGAAF
jgi:hypothetical protein